MYVRQYGDVCDLGVVELHGIVGGQRHTQAFVQKLSQWVLRVLEEEAVVAQRGHGDRDLGQVVQVLQHRTLRKTRTRIRDYRHRSTLVRLSDDPEQLAWKEKSVDFSRII